jgi:MFS family permease
VVGPLIGGAFADSSATWCLGFYLNLVVGGIFTPSYLLILPSNKPIQSTTNDGRLKSFDYLAAVLQAGALASITMAMNFGGTLYAWKSAQIISLFIVAGFLFVVFIVQQEFCILLQPEQGCFQSIS